MNNIKDQMMTLIDKIKSLEYEDNQRYKIIVEEKRSDESKSNTKGVNW